jgi:enoyl-CoA hydratase/carnithine racemase
MMSPRPIRTTLFNVGGVSLSATTVTSSSATLARAAGGDDGDGDGSGGADDDDRRRESGIVLTLALNRHFEKNAVNPDMVSLLISALDAIDGHPVSAGTNNKALIITGLALSYDDEDEDGAVVVDVDGPSSKFFSNGLDLEWMMRANASAVAPSDGGGGGGANDAVSELIESFNGDVLARILTLPFRTVAAINGHCIGAGLFLALACDYRIMRTGRGFLQWPEARLGMRLTKGFAELTRAKVVAPGCDRSVLREGVLGARRYASAKAVASGIVDAEYPVEVLYEEAFRLAVGGLPDSKSGMDLEFFDPVAYTEMKVEMYADAYRALKFGRVADPPHSRI